jgi:curved DNA-binding protein CbpA
MNKGENPYRILDVGSAATTTEIKKSYRLLALKHHPDKQVTEDERDAAQHVFAKLSAAYSILTDPIKKRDWDLANRDWDKPAVRKPSVFTKASFATNNNAKSDFDAAAAASKKKAETEAAIASKKKEEAAAAAAKKAETEHATPSTSASTETPDSSSSFSPDEPAEVPSAPSNDSFSGDSDGDSDVDSVNTPDTDTDPYTSYTYSFRIAKAAAASRASAEGKEEPAPDTSYGFTAPSKPKLSKKTTAEDKPLDTSYHYVAPTKPKKAAPKKKTTTEDKPMDTSYHYVAPTKPKKVATKKTVVDKPLDTSYHYVAPTKPKKAAPQKAEEPKPADSSYNYVAPPKKKVAPQKTEEPKPDSSYNYVAPSKAKKVEPPKKKNEEEKKENATQEEKKTWTRGPSVVKKPMWQQQQPPPIPSYVSPTGTKPKMNNQSAHVRTFSTAPPFRTSHSQSPPRGRPQPQRASYAVPASASSVPKPSAVPRLSANFKMAVPLTPKERRASTAVPMKSSIPQRRASTAAPMKSPIPQRRASPPLRTSHSQSPPRGRPQATRASYAVPASASSVPKPSAVPREHRISANFKIAVPLTPKERRASTAVSMKKPIPQRRASTAAPMKSPVPQRASLAVPLRSPAPRRPSSAIPRRRASSAAPVRSHARPSTAVAPAPFRKDHRKSDTNPTTANPQFHDPFEVFDRVMKEEFGTDYEAPKRTSKPMSKDQPLSVSTSTKTVQHDDGRVEVKTITTIVRQDGSIEKVTQSSVAEANEVDHRTLPRDSNATFQPNTPSSVPKGKVQRAIPTSAPTQPKKKVGSIPASAPTLSKKKVKAPGKQRTSTFGFKAPM